MRDGVLTWRSCFNHLGATLGIASFSWAARRGTPVRAWGAPYCMELRIVISTGSLSVVVFSKICRKRRVRFVTIVRGANPEIRIGNGQSVSDNRLLTANSAVLDAEKLSLVVTRDCGVRVHVSWQHWQASGHVRLSHPFFF